ncbi:MAG: glycoside hydrolase [Ignavibacteriales bacterium CG_4_9_14_3_um_filter_30_11]|nr:MAG: glycoside hydrolase [Ignavibacteriales bacterium CG_4_9_14_3_um_filter_30_11]
MKVKNYSILSLINTIIILIVLFTFEIINAQTIPANVYSDLRWRQVGPYRGGWGTVAEGIPDDPNTYYFGGAGGGVWKTIDAGRTWQPLMQQENSAAIGALAIAPSNQKVIYVGTGQVTYRYDNLGGDGVYKTIDGGITWKNIGLNDSRHIGAIIVNQKDENNVLVAALGHVFGPNKERGLFLTKDGGKNWKQVLFVNKNTGAIDLASDPSNPSIIYAAFWKLRMHPWLDYYLPQRSADGSGIYKSSDGGETWIKLESKNLPTGNLGRIGLAVAQGNNGQIIYATIDAENDKQGLYRSNDGGINWTHVNDDGVLSANYFSKLTVDPQNFEIVYFTGQSIRKSIDGGKTYSIFKGSPGGDDYHHIWINPKDSKYIITGSDQGTVITVNGGKSWSSWYNQPTGQFYHITTDDQFPYRIYSGQQDNGTVSILSRGPYGVIEERDWHPVGGDERDYQVPKPGNPNIVFGTGLGGHINRFNNLTRQSAEISPWPVSSYGALQTTVKYRYTWITPLAFSPIGKHTMYFGAQVLFKSNDDGDYWEIISPDLSGKKNDAKDCNQELQNAFDCGYGVIYTIAPSPVKEDMIWIGTDDGLIHLTEDGGNNWKNITPPQIPIWGRVDAISPSVFSKDAAYVAVNTHRLDQLNPIILKTKDAGKTWKLIINGLPENEYINSVRSDNVKEGLLFASTNKSVYVSFNDGENWQPLTLNLSTSQIRDLHIHNVDLIAGTQGRGIWILDDISHLRQINSKILSNKVYLFSPADTYRLRGNENRDTPPPPETPLGENPPKGAIIDYWIKDEIKTPIKLSIYDSNNNLVRNFSSEDTPEKLNPYRYFDERWVSEHKELYRSSGMHRFIWDLRYERPKSLNYGFTIAAVWDQGTPIIPEGSLILPGKYKVVLSADGKDYIQYLNVKLDPRINVPMKDLYEQLQLSNKIIAVMEAIVSNVNEIENYINENKDNKNIVEIKKLKNDMTSVSNVLSGLTSKVQSADNAPSQGQKDLFADYKEQYHKLLTNWYKIQNKLPPKM